jgi:hypothetical protein
MGFEDSGFWVAVGAAATAGGALARPIQNIIIFSLATRGATAAEKEKIIKALAQTRQFGLWSKPRWPQRQSRKSLQAPPAIEQIQPGAVEDEAA